MPQSLFSISKQGLLTMNDKISLWISGNQRRSGYTPILSVNEPPFSYPGYDERKGMQSLDFYIVVKTTADYTQYTLIHNKISTADGYPNAILKIAIGIPAGMCIEHDKSPYDVLIAVKDTFVKEYMTPTYGVEGGFSFTDKLVTEDLFVKILDSYKLKGDSSSQKVMRGTSTKTVYTEDVSKYLKALRSDNDIESLGELVVAEGSHSTTVEASHKTQPKTVAPQSKDCNPNPPKPRNFKNIIIAFLVIVVVGQGIFLLRNKSNDNQNITAQNIEATNDGTSSLEEKIEENKDSIELLTIEIRESLRKEDVSFGEIKSLHARAASLNGFTEEKLFDTLNVYHLFCDTISKNFFNNGLKYILGSASDGTYSIIGLDKTVKFKTNINEKSLIRKFNRIHQDIIINYFIGTYENDHIMEYSIDSKAQLYKDATKNHENWTSLKHYKDHIKDVVKQ